MAEHSRGRFTLLFALLAVILAPTAPALAQAAPPKPSIRASIQPPVTSLDQLSARLKEHDTVLVVDMEGRTFEGTFVKATPDALSIYDIGLNMTLSADRVRRVVLPGPTHKKWGALIGLAGGAGAGFLVGSLSKPQFPFSQGGLQLLGTAFFGGIGCGAGAIVGEIVRGKPSVLYEASPTAPHTEFAVGPLVVPHARGVSLIVRF